MRYADFFGRSATLRKLVQLRSGQVIALWYDKPMEDWEEGSLKLSGDGVTVDRRCESRSGTLSFGEMGYRYDSRRRLNVSGIFSMPYAGGRAYFLDYFPLSMDDEGNTRVLVREKGGLRCYAADGFSFPRFSCGVLQDRLCRMASGNARQRRLLRRYLRRALPSVYPRMGYEIRELGLTGAVDCYLEYYRQSGPSQLRVSTRGRSIRLSSWSLVPPSLSKALELGVAGRAELMRSRLVQSSNTRSGNAWLSLSRPIPVRTAELDDRLLDSLEPGLTVDRLRRRMSGLCLWTPLGDSQHPEARRAFPGLVALVRLQFHSQVGRLLTSGQLMPVCRQSVSRLKRRKRPARRRFRRRMRPGWRAWFPELL